MKVSISQSRCFSFQPDTVRLGNRIIETRVSISQSRCFSFQQDVGVSLRQAIVFVSISQSRCFSFQQGFFMNNPLDIHLFQSRNRDAFLFNQTFAPGQSCRHTNVSISQSRCFSFQLYPFGGLIVPALTRSDPARDVFWEAWRCWQSITHWIKVRIIRVSTHL